MQSVRDYGTIYILGHAVIVREHPASYLQCSAYLKYLERRTQIMARDNLNISNINNKNLQTNISYTKSGTRNTVNMRVSPDNINQLVSASKSINKYETRQTNSPRSYAATINNNNTTVNDDLSDLNGLMSELHKLKQLIDIPHMIMVIKNLNNIN